MSIDDLLASGQLHDQPGFSNFEMVESLHSFMSPNHRYQVMAYRGAMSQDVIHHVVSLADAHLRLCRASTRRRKSVVHVLIECLQNVYLHRMEHDSHSFVSMSLNYPHIEVATCNAVSFVQATRLSATLTDLKTRSMDELKDLFVNTIQQPLGPKYSGAGLGLLRIMKESAGQIQFRFDPVPDSATGIEKEPGAPHDFGSHTAWYLTMEAKISDVIDSEVEEE